MTTQAGQYLLPVEVNIGGANFSKQTVKLKGSQVAELNRLLAKFEDDNWKEYGEAIYE